MQNTLNTQNLLPRFVLKRPPKSPLNSQGCLVSGADPSPFLMSGEHNWGVATHSPSPVSTLPLLFSHRNGSFLSLCSILMGFDLNASPSVGSLHSSQEWPAPLNIPLGRPPIQNIWWSKLFKKSFFCYKQQGRGHFSCLQEVDVESAPCRLSPI